TYYVGGTYEIYVRKRRYCIGTSSGIWGKCTVVDAASIVPVQPTVAVVDANHAAIVGANTLLNAFIQQHPKAAITDIAFDGEDGQIKYEVEGFDST
ncbi:hypothetical protein PZH35_14105, partial [Veillonella atypica]|nr:hypothetical protein [Veillonella atypica]